jgi:hypothetical protein
VIFKKEINNLINTHKYWVETIFDKDGYILQEDALIFYISYLEKRLIKILNCARTCIILYVYFPDIKIHKTMIENTCRHNKIEIYILKTIKTRLFALL